MKYPKQLATKRAIDLVTLNLSLWLYPCSELGEPYSVEKLTSLSFSSQKFKPICLAKLP